MIFIWINKLLKYIKKCSDKKFTILKGPIKKGGTQHRCPDISKLKKLGYKSKKLNFGSFFQ